MNKKNILHNLIYVIAGSIIAVGLSYAVDAASYTAPSGTPPANNTATPLNVGTADQVKQGGLSVTTFIANQNAELDGNTFFGGIWHADPANTDKTIHFGGTDPKGLARKVAVTMTGGFSNSGNIASTPLSNTSNSTVCSDANGTVVLCAATDLCSNISGAQATMPAGYVSNGDGSCSIAPKRFYSITTSGDLSAEYFTNNVIDGKPTYKSTGAKTGTPTPWIASLGLNNDDPYGWLVDDIQTVYNTKFTSSNTKLLQVTEKGSYNIKISSHGQIGIKGKFSGDNNILGVNFFLVVNKGLSGEQWIPLTTTYNDPYATFEGYPNPTSGQLQKVNFYVTDAKDNSLTLSGNGQSNGDKYAYAPYSFSFEKTMTLVPGNTLDVEAEIYGWSQDTGLFGNVNGLGSSFNNFFYYIETPYQGTIFDITETPS